ncbi:MAG: nickel pincer cofactor biosynthesis protein LarB [Methanomicrobiales archaeon]|nr:nickel pincer cofactor biosynthesis protein LarB [Methanomicrobiales archaeon]
MHASSSLAEILRRYKAGEIPLSEAEEQIEGLRLEKVEDIACLDLGRSSRCGMPEVVLAEGKETEQLTAIIRAYVNAAGRCLVTRADPLQANAVETACARDGIDCTYHPVPRILVAARIPPPDRHGGIVGIITAGTSDIRVAEEARIIAEEMGCTVRSAYDVGAAGIHRLFPAIRGMVDAQVIIVAAGREGTLPAVVAGLVDVPVIGVPVSTGYGFQGEGRAALASMLQSCSVLTVVNIDAGFTAGAFAARIARMVALHE